MENTQEAPKWSAHQIDMCQILDSCKHFFKSVHPMPVIGEKNKRPEYVAINPNKIFIFDAKRKGFSEINDGDRRRIKQAEEEIKQSPEDIKLSKVDIHAYSFKKFFVYNGEEIRSEGEFTYIPIKCFQSWLSNKFYFKEPNKRKEVIADVAKWAKDGILDDSEIYLLARGLVKSQDIKMKVFSKLDSYSSKYNELIVISNPEIGKEIHEIKFVVRHNPTKKISHLNP